MESLEYKKLFRQYNSPKQAPEILTIPRMQFLMIDGKGDPNTSKRFQAAVATLYGLVYGLKFTRKRAKKAPDFTIGPLEGLWWSETGKPFEVGKKDDWLWTLLLWVPDVITKSAFQAQLAILKVKKPDLLWDSVRLEHFEEGVVVQMLHVGPYATEPATVDLMHSYAKQQGYAPSGKHHELYLGDPRRSSPEKLRTIVRHPITPLPRD